MQSNAHATWTLNFDGQTLSIASAVLATPVPMAEDTCLAASCTHPRVRTVWYVLHGYRTHGPAYMHSACMRIDASYPRAGRPINL